MSYVLVKNEAETSASEDGSSTHVPGGWGHLRLDELYQISMGTTLLASSTQEKPKQGYIPVYSATEKDHYFGYVLATTVKNVLREGDIVVPARGTIGSPKYVSLMAASTQTTIQMRPRGEINKYNFYYIKHHRDSLFPVLPGTIPQLTVANVSRCFILVPPLEEQTAIANILSDQEALIAQYDNLIALHEKRFAYLSDELLSGRVRLNAGDGTIVCSKNEGWQEVDLNGDTVKIPKNWNTATLPDLCVLTNGSSFKPSEKEEYGIPIVRIQNLTEVASEYHYYNGSKKGLVPLGAGDLLFSWSGTIGIYTYTLSSGYLNQHIFKVTPFKIDGAYAKYFLRRNIDKFQRSGLTMPHITLAEIRKRKLVVCFDETQQKLIGKVLSDQEALIAQYKKLRDAEKKRFDWLSDALLSGTYRVKVEA